MKNERYITLEQVAEYTNLPLTKVYDLSSKNRLPGKVVWGRRTVRVDREKLDRWMDEQAFA